VDAENPPLTLAVVLGLEVVATRRPDLVGPDITRATKSA
jgi:hypothetical protein